MERTRMERFISSMAYAVALAGIGLIVLYEISGRFAAVLVLGGALPFALLALRPLRESRFILTHTIHALMLYGGACLLSGVPVAVGVLRELGVYRPRSLHPWFGMNLNTADVLCIALGLVVGLTLLIIAHESLWAAARGGFLENWPPMQWLQSRLMPDEEVHELV